MVERGSRAKGVWAPTQEQASSTPPPQMDDKFAMPSTARRTHAEAIAGEFTSANSAFHQSITAMIARSRRERR